MNSLTARERRLVALGLLALVLALAWCLVAAPILNGFSERAAERSAALLEERRNALMISSFGSLRAQVQAQRRSSAVYSFNTPSATNAFELSRDRVARLTTASGGLVQAIRSEPAPAREVRLQADVRISLAGLTSLMRSLENDRPYATVDKLFITASDAQSASGPPLLEVRLELSYSYSGAQ